MPKFNKTYCSQCGGEFGPGDSGYSHCEDHIKDLKRKPGNPRRGKKERITINIEPDNLRWLKEQVDSYSKIVNQLIQTQYCDAHPDDCIGCQMCEGK